MCGFFGVVDLYNNISDDDVNDVRNGTDAIRYRGPDDGNVVYGHSFCFGFRRLSIIDVYAKSQPYMTDDKSITMVCNGEIYNYKVLRSELIKKGYKFKTNTDVEVVLHGYCEWKQSLWKKLNGIFSIVIYDDNEKQLYMVRDHLGVKPLHFIELNNKVYFSSDYNAFSYINNYKLSLNNEALLSYLSFRYVIGEQTFYKNIVDVLPGGCINYHTSGMIKSTYWDIPVEHTKSIGLHDCIEKLDFYMDQSVSGQLISDVPLGAFISGGLDSSLLLSYIVKYIPNVKTYISGFDKEKYNEFKYADIVASHLKLSVNKILMDESKYIDLMDEAIKYRGEPLSVPHESVFLNMTQHLSKDITVVMSGEGADELFAGYGRIFRSPHDFLMGQKAILRSFIDYSPEQGKYQHNLSPINHFLQRYSWFTKVDKENILNKEIFNQRVFDEYSMTYIENLFSQIDHLSYYQGIYYLLAKLHLPNLLNSLDRMTMAASVEARVPFLDYRLVEFASKIPTNFKLKWKNRSSKYMAIFHNSEYISERYDIPKYILKELARGKIPDSIIDRKKMGFPVPLNDWVSGSLGGVAKEVLLASDAVVKDVFNIDEIIKYFDNKSQSQQYDLLGKKIWMLVNFELWARQKFL